jgi:hypothetical protein
VKTKSGRELPRQQEPVYARIYSLLLRATQNQFHLGNGLWTGFDRLISECSKGYSWARRGRVCSSEEKQMGRLADSRLLQLRQSSTILVG